MASEAPQDDYYSDTSSNQSKGAHSRSFQSAKYSGYGDDDRDESKPVTVATTGSKTRKKETGLRKGKWTVEEEMYTNKVIENFNAGILELDTNDEMGVTTLRSYLSKKLGCDPMRITKKYTGSSCLGKKVYHADNFRGFNRVEIDNAAKELRILEQKFRSKLDEINRKKTSGLYVSTPSIDALIRNTYMVGEKRKIENRGSSSEGVTEESGEHNLQQRITNNEYSSSINFPDDIISNLLSHVRPQNIGDLIEAYRNQPDLLNKEASIPPQETFRSEEYRDAILPILNSVSSVFSITLATGAHSFLSDHSAATNFHVDTYYSSSTNNNNSFTNDSANIASSSSAMGSNLAIASSSSSSSSSSSNNSSSRRSDYDNSRMYGSMQIGKHLDEGGYSSMRDIGGAESNHGNGYGNVADSNLLALESDQNAAADSLIGFINHIHREQSRSHDDLVDYVESVMVESVERRSRSYNDLTSLSPHHKHGKSLHDNSNHHLGYSQESKSTHGDKDYCTKLTCVTGSSPRKSRSHNDLFDLIEKLVGCSEESNDVVAIDREDRKNKLSIRTVLSDS